MRKLWLKLVFLLFPLSLYALNPYQIPGLRKLISACSGLHYLKDIAIPPSFKLTWEDELDLYVAKGTYPPPQTRYLTYNSYSYHLLDKAFPFMKDGQRVLILGGGSGYESIVIARRFLNSHIDVTDISESAFRSLEMNSKAHGLEHRLRRFKSDVFDAVTEDYDLILFAAPRPITWREALLGLGSKKISQVFSENGSRNNFDPEGKIHERLLKGFPKFLKPKGVMIILTDSKYPQADHPGIESEVLFEAPWGDAKYNEDFQILAYKKIHTHDHQ